MAKADLLNSPPNAHSGSLPHSVNEPPFPWVLRVNHPLFPFYPWNHQHHLTQSPPPIPNPVTFPLPLVPPWSRPPHSQSSCSGTSLLLIHLPTWVCLIYELDHGSNGDIQSPKSPKLIRPCKIFSHPQLFLPSSRPLLWPHWPLGCPSHMPS